MRAVAGEPVPLARCFGVSMIMCGILIVASYEIQ
jgi:hypothetical protein